MIGLFLFLFLFQDPQEILFQKAVAALQPKIQKEPANLAVIRCASYFLDAPYLEKTLEGNPTEQLVIRLDGFDCTTFVESVLALNQTLRSKDVSYAHFCSLLTRLRYRQGLIKGYSSRLHYISEWRIQGMESGFFEDLNQALNGSVYDKPINFMTHHADLYPGLADPRVVTELVEVEKQLNDQVQYFHPLENIPYDQLTSGDIVAITTSVPGLDVMHMGFLVRREGALFLLHASQKSLRVEISAQTLSEYLDQRHSATGLFIMRPLGD